VSPWLITTTARPATAVLVSVMARVVGDPATAGVATAVIVLAGAALLLRMRARLRQHRRSAS
jgi:predicted S18 family serine protease